MDIKLKLTTAESLIVLTALDDLMASDRNEDDKRIANSIAGRIRNGVAEAKKKEAEKEAEKKRKEEQIKNFPICPFCKKGRMIPDMQLFHSMNPGEFILQTAKCNKCHRRTGRTISVADYKGESK